MQQLFIIGGETIFTDPNEPSQKSCTKYKKGNNNYFKVSSLNKARSAAACTVFEGRIVVSGGHHNDDENNSVEAYDYYGNKWNFLPNMIRERSEHSAVSMGNKMFVIGGYKTDTCEVFNSIDKNFTSILPYPVKLTDTPFLFRFDNKIVVTYMFTLVV